MANQIKLSFKKKCTKCKKLKINTDFYKCSKNKSGLYSSCIVCERLRSFNRKDQKSKANAIYYKTIKGHLNSIYNAMLRRCNPNNKKTKDLYYGVKVLITKEEFINFSLNNSDYILIYNKWKKTGYNRKLSPSIDRIDSDLHYSLDNIRWLPCGIHSTLTNNKRWGNIHARA